MDTAILVLVKLDRDLTVGAFIADRVPSVQGIRYVPWNSVLISV